jgi:plasmid stabilization system protein ParE
MAAKILWSPSAKKSFDDLIAFLETKWGKRVIENLFSSLNLALLSLTE